ncbi:MAG: phosphate ABC transporter permease subunit PstC [Candidatus Thermoplasmatota archaeon]|nr:phosphate ABC transporter permease subunit PstC [Candidatus Thermoplasmatota archaeon]
MAIVPAVALISIFYFVFNESLPLWRFSGFSFFTTYLWDPGFQYQPPILVHGVLAPPGAQFGLDLFLLGTISTSLLAIIIAFPISFLITINVELYLPSRIKKFMISMIELFAGIPSVVYGLWGIVVLEPILFKNVEPWMARHLSFIPGFGGEVYSGAGLVASGIILSFMIIPIITSVIVNSFDSVPKEVKEGLFSLGATRWEVGKYLTTRFSRSSMVGGTLLGLGRALGETMAVLMVSGAIVNTLPTSFYSATNTMAAAITSLLDSALTDSTRMDLAALAALAVVLMGISLGVSLVGRKIAGRGALRGYESD